MRLLCGLHTPDLKATLPNLLGLLQGKGYKTEMEQFQKSQSDLETSSIVSSRGYVNLRFPIGSSNVVVSDPVLEPMKNEYQSEQLQQQQCTRRRAVKGERSECGPGLSEILAIPEAFLNKEIPTSCLKNYIAFERHRKFNVATANGGIVYFF